MIKKEVTIYDIAENLGLSASTISRGLKGHHTVSAKTQRKIVHTAELMGYRINSFAANLRTKKTNTIGVIVPRLNSNLMSDVIAGIEKIINEAGYNLIISQSFEHFDKEIRNARTMFNNRVDGILASIVLDSLDTKHFEPFSKKGVPVIFFDRVPASGRWPSITINNELAGYQITKHLIQQGAKKIVHITATRLHSVYLERFNGYLRALKEYDIEFNEELLIQSVLNEDAGTRHASKIIELRADALFVSNDSCAASCVNELKILGKKIPEDILCAGFNNDIISRMVTPTLTTINYPGFEMGTLAAMTLLDHLSGRLNIFQTPSITVGMELIARGSTEKRI